MPVTEFTDFKSDETYTILHGTFSTSRIKLLYLFIFAIRLVPVFFSNYLLDARYKRLSRAIKSRTCRSPCTVQYLGKVYLCVAFCSLRPNNPSKDGTVLCNWSSSSETAMVVDNAVTKSHSLSCGKL